MAAYTLIEVNPSPTESDVRRALEGNLCRCTGYRKIIDVVLSLDRINHTTETRRAQRFV